MSLVDVKTPASRRSVPVPRSVLNLLAAHIESYGEGRDGVLLRHRGGYFGDNAFTGSGDAPRPEQDSSRAHFASTRCGTRSPRR
jgi:hypothetical protein